jgi:FixJ family two-component response regulator
VFITAQDEPSVLNAMRQTRRLFLKNPLDEDRLINAIAHATQDQG